MKDKKERTKFDIDRYRQIVADGKGTVHRADVYAAMSPSIKRWVSDNLDYAVKAWFDHVEETVLKATHTLGQEEFGFLNKDTIIALGNSQRIRLGNCTRRLCIQRRQLLVKNKENQVLAADREIAALNIVIDQLKGNQTVDDLLPE